MRPWITSRRCSRRSGPDEIHSGRATVSTDWRAELLVDSRCRLGESPFWDPARQDVAWVDIDASVLHRYGLHSGVTSAESLPEDTTFAAAASDGGVVLANSMGLFHQAPDGGITTLGSGWWDEATHRTNDGAVDAAGRVWLGATRRDRAPGSGAIGVVDGGWHVRMPGLTLPNGIAWSPDGRTVYFVDSLDGVLWAADFNIELGTVGEPAPWFELDRAAGLIDGICVDIEGGVWAAVWGGHCVIHLESGTAVRKIAVGAEKVTSCAFGPEASTLLYITSADPDGSGDPGAGGLHVADVGVPGLPVTPAGVPS
jgi:sugar lactone lactonase YvrE